MPNAFDSLFSNYMQLYKTTHLSENSFLISELLLNGQYWVKLDGGCSAIYFESNFYVFTIYGIAPATQCYPLLSTAKQGR